MEYKYFANMLIDIDTSNLMPMKLRIKEEEGKQFEPQMEIPELSEFCEHYKAAGHGLRHFLSIKRVIQTSENRARVQTMIEREQQQPTAIDGGRPGADKKTDSSL